MQKLGEHSMIPSNVLPLTLPDPKTAGIRACDQALMQIEAILPNADEQQTEAALDWLRMFMEARKLREFWAKSSHLLRRAEMKWGELHPAQQGRRTDLETSLPGKEVEINDRTASDFRTMAENPEIVESVIESAGDRIVTRSEVLREIEKAKPHVAQNSGNNEWYTPVEYIEAARVVMGDIDFDPASSEEANQVVKAKRFYSAEDDALRPGAKWTGRVWMNPPYAADLIGPFCERLVAGYNRGSIFEAIVLVNNATETQWFGGMADSASAVCFPRSRVRFWIPDGGKGAPLQGQALLYFGGAPETFLSAYADIGWGAMINVV